MTSAFEAAYNWMDDLAIPTDDVVTAVKQIETLSECAGKVGLQINFEKIKFFCSKLDIQNLNTTYGQISRVPHFKYLGEILEPPGGEKAAQKTRLQKFRKAYGRVHNIYNKNCLSRHAKIRHYNTVIKPEVLYASETLTLNGKGDLENILKEERRILRKIFGPRKTEDGYRLRSRKVTEELSNIAADIRKIRLKFYGHVRRLPASRLTHKILTYIEHLKNIPWVLEVKKDLEKAHIDSTDTADRNLYRKKINGWKVQPENEVKKKTGAKWTEEGKGIHGERMRAVWQLRKQNR
ncbi:uncharacterized protein [Anabrus simplex]|uniref:uncharacterized protein n=1 Tax=Anabrus simplex TaxID=316456 RepID=UPI0035A35647